MGWYRKVGVILWFECGIGGSVKVKRIWGGEEGFLGCQWGLRVVKGGLGW